MLSKMLKLKDHINSPREKVFIKIEKPSSVTESLKLLSRHQQTLIDEKIRLVNRLGKKLLEVCLQILKLSKLKNKKIIAILARYPDFSKYKRITLKSLLKIKGIGEIRAPFLHRYPRPYRRGAFKIQAPLVLYLPSLAFLCIF